MVVGVQRAVEAAQPVRGAHTIDGLTRSDLQGPPVRELRCGIPRKADLLVYRVGGEEVLLKDYSRKRGGWRSVLGRVFTRREARALRALRGMEGVPAYLGRPDRYSVAMSFVEGTRVRRGDPDFDGNEEFVRALERTVQQMHRRGVVHLDLKHRSNLMATPERQPVVLDFESAVCFDPNSALGRLAVDLLGGLDWLAVQNWKRRLCPRMLAGSGRDRRAAELSLRLRGWFFPTRLVNAFLDIFLRGMRRGRPSS
jgi:hypothetical protein